MAFVAIAFVTNFTSDLLLRSGCGHGVLNLEASTGYAQSWNGEHKVFSHDIPHRFLHNGQQMTLSAGPESNERK